jgi:hypothetical protein
VLKYKCMSLSCVDLRLVLCSLMIEKKTIATHMKSKLCLKIHFVQRKKIPKTLIEIPIRFYFVKFLKIFFNFRFISIASFFFYLTKKRNERKLCIIIVCRKYTESFMFFFINISYLVFFSFPSYEFM